jgi:hypothetical protein
MVYPCHIFVHVPSKDHFAILASCFKIVLSKLELHLPSLARTSKLIAAKSDPDSKITTFFNIYKIVDRTSGAMFHVRHIDFSY